jgi:hypothetical protein
MKESTPHFRDYSFDEWQELPFEIKRDIWNNYWNPYRSEVGKSTRDAILEKFRLSYPELMEQAIGFGFDYFGWELGCIYVVVPKPSIKVPKEFASIYVNKGVFYQRLNEKTILVNWRYGGSKAEFTAKTSL